MQTAFQRLLGEMTMWVIRITLTLMCLMVAKSATASWFYIRSECKDDRVSIQVGGNHDGHGDIAAFHVYRQALATIACGLPVKVTTDPIPVPIGEQFAVDIEDDSVHHGVAYEYFLVSVNAEGRQTGPGIAGDWAKCGNAPIAHGAIWGRGGWPVVVYLCEGTCYGPDLIELYPEDLIQLINTGTPLLLYGEIYNHQYDGPLMTITGWEVMSCHTAVTSSVWGLVKQLYR